MNPPAENCVYRTGGSGRSQQPHPRTRGDERREIIRILTEFSNILRPSIPEILQSYEFLAEIDFIRAKSYFAIQTNSLKPAVENEQLLDWTMAVHPYYNFH